MYCYVRDCTNSAKNLREKKKGSDLTKYFLAPEDKLLLEKWRRVIPRSDKVFSPNDKLCDLHFLGSEVQWFTETKLPNGNVRRLLVDQPVLKPGTIPSIFPQEKLETAKTTVKTTPIPLKEKVEIPKPIIKTPSVHLKEKFSTPKSVLRTPVVIKKDKFETPKSSVRIRLKEPPVSLEKRHTQRVKRRSTILEDYVTDDELSQVHGQGGTTAGLVKNSAVFSTSVKKRKTENSELQPIIRLVPLECLMDQNISQSKVSGKPLSELISQSKVPVKPLGEKCTQEIDHELKKVIEIPLLTKLKPKKSVTFKTKEIVQFKPPPKKAVPRPKMKMMTYSARDSQFKSPPEEDKEETAILNEVKTEIPDIEEELARMEMDDEDVKSSDIVAVNSLEDDSVVVKSEEEDIENSYSINEEAKDVSSFSEEDVVIKSEDESDEVSVRGETFEGTSMNGEGSLEADVNTRGVDEGRERSEVAVDAEQNKDVQYHKGDDSLPAENAKDAEDQSVDNAEVAGDNLADEAKVAEDQCNKEAEVAAAEGAVSGTNGEENQEIMSVGEPVRGDEGEVVSVIEESSQMEKSASVAAKKGSDNVTSAESDEAGQALGKDAEVTSLGKDHGEKILNIDESSELETESHGNLVPGESANKVPIEQKSDDIGSNDADASTIVLDENSDVQMRDESDDAHGKDQETEVSSKRDEDDSVKATTGSKSEDKVIEISDNEAVVEAEGSEETPAGNKETISAKGEENPAAEDGNHDDSSLLNRTLSNEVGSVQDSGSVQDAGNAQDAQEDDDVHMDTDTHEDIEEIEAINEDEVNIEAEGPKEGTAARNVENEDDIDIEAEVARLVSEVGEGSEEPVKDKNRARKASQGKEIVLRETLPIAGEITSAGVQNLFSPETIQEILKQIKLPLTTPVTLRIAPLLNTPISSSPGKGKVMKTTRRKGGRGGSSRGGNRHLSRAGGSKEQSSIEQFRQLTKTRTVFDFPTYISDIDDDIQYWKLCQIIKESFHELIEARNTKTSIGRLTLSITFNKPKRQELESEAEICYEGLEAVNR